MHSEKYKLCVIFRQSMQPISLTWYYFLKQKEGNYESKSK